ncbi:MAG: DUF3850 domain-containing protein [Lachnospiraceae bacterium]|nr:DUF3850 domain-containing protein [Lachnospiraceae bacterium]
MIHKIKILEKYAERVLSGEKRFVLRFNDSDYQTGDLIEFIVIDRDIKQIDHELCNKKYQITYILWNVGVRKDCGNESYYIIPHDLEEFSGLAAEYGIDWSENKNVQMTIEDMEGADDFCSRGKEKK